ncbi:MAG: hypothetical protein ABJG68_15860 [Crocinitomicaceae bacterium]
MRLIILLCGVVLAFSSCKKTDETIIYGDHYFPADSGRYVIYDVMDIVHDDPSNVHDTSRFQIKEIIGEEIIDNEGDPTRKLYRYFRENDTLNWSLQDVWIVKKTGRSVELVEENQRKIKMAFSISYDQYWDGNALNNLDAEQCYYSHIYEPISVGSIDYDSSVVVEHQDFLTYIEYLRFYEVYAPNVGKIQSYYKDVEINEGDTLNVEKGTELFYEAVAFGKE